MNSKAYKFTRRVLSMMREVNLLNNLLIIIKSTSNSVECLLSMSLSIE